jgi:Fur family ferric uptake transcriptional regulator
MAMQAEQMLAGRDLRVTQARILVLRTMEALGHGTPEQIYSEAEPELPGLSLSTVYRTLDTLVARGLAGQTELPGQSRIYHLPQHGEHVHVICRQCRDVAEIDADVAGSFAMEILAASGFHIERGHLTMFGQCSRCSSADADSDN